MELNGWAFVDEHQSMGMCDGVVVVAVDGREREGRIVEAFVHLR